MPAAIATAATPTAAASPARAAAPRVHVHTLCFKNKLQVPAALAGAPGATVGQVRAWTADRLHFPVGEAQLIAGGRRLADATTVAELAAAGTLDVYLVCRSPAPGTAKPVKIYVKDTTQVPNKTYAVKMDPGQTAVDLQRKLYEKSTCKVPPRHQRLTCRGKVVDSTYSLREYTVSQRRDRIVFYLTKNPATLDEEELPLEVHIPSSHNARLKAGLRAGQTVGNVRQLLQASYGVSTDQYTLLNAAGLVLQDDMTVRTAVTLPPLTGGAAGEGGVGQPAAATNLTLFAVPIARERLTHGITGVHVYLNPEHHAALGIVTDPRALHAVAPAAAMPTAAAAAPAAATAAVAASPSARVKRKKSSAGAAGECSAVTGAAEQRAQGTKKKKKQQAKGKGSKVLKGFWGLFNKNSAGGGKSKSKAPAAVAAVAVEEAAQQQKLKKKTTQTKKAKKHGGYKSKLKAMLRASRFASHEDEVEAYRAKLSQSLGGGAYKRVDSI